MQSLSRVLQELTHTCTYIPVGCAWYSIDILIVVITSLVDVHVLSLAELSDDLNAEDIVGEDLSIQSPGQPRHKIFAPPMEAATDRDSCIGEDKEEGKEEDGKGVEDEDREWSKFQSEFDSLMEASEQQLEREQAVAKQLNFDQLKQSMMVSLITSLSSSLTSAMAVESEDSPVIGRRSPVCCEGEEERGSHKWMLPSTNVGTLSGSGDPVRYSEQSSRAGSHDSINGNRSPGVGHQRSGLLQSSRFEHLSESELDRALEAIKEEEGSKEGSASPTPAVNMSGRWVALVTG